MKQRIHRIIAWTLVLLMAFGGTNAFAATGASSGNADSAVKIIFPDTVNHWSQKYVAKLAALGIVNGLGDGTYGAQINVKQQEIIAMAVRLMGAEEEADKLSNVGTSLQVSDWARKYVLYALQEGILDPSEELKNNGHINWGERTAKREWVAKVIIRALGKDQEAKEAADRATSFKDNHDISADALGYVNVAVDLGIITGTSSNEFLPLQSIDRAQTAAIFARAEQYLPQSDAVVKGGLTAITADTLRVRDESGQVHMISLGNSTAYYRFDADKQILKSDLAVGQQVYVVLRDHLAVYVEVISDREPTESIFGQFERVDTIRRTIKIKIDGREVEFELDENVAVIDVDGRGSSLSQLIPLSEIELKKSTLSNRIIEIVVKDKPISKRSSGTISNINPEEITILDEETNRLETYPLVEQVIVTHEGKSLTLDDLVISDEIAYRVLNGFVTEITVTAKYVEPVKGTFEGFNEKKTTIFVRNEEGARGYDLAEDVAVHIEGMVYATTNDIFSGDILMLTFDGNGLVRSIKVENRNVEHLQMLELVSVDENLEFIVVKVDKAPRLLYLTEDTILEAYGLEYPVSELPKYITEKQRIDVVLSGEYVQRIKRSEGYTGKVKDYNPAARKIVISNPAIGDLSLNLSPYAFVQIINQSSTTLSDVKIGDEVRVVLSPEDLLVTQIQVKRTLKHTIETINATNRMITALDENNNKRYLSLNSSLAIHHPSKPYATIHDLSVGQIVTVTYYGSSAESINILDYKFGTVEHADRLYQNLTVQTHDGQILIIDTSKNFELTRGAQKIDISALNPGDRISIAQDHEGYTLAQVVLRQMKIVNQVESIGEISFVNQMGEVEKMQLAPDVIVRAGSSKISLNDLKKNDRVYVYVVNGVIYEIDKL